MPSFAGSCAAQTMTTPSLDAKQQRTGYTVETPPPVLHVVAWREGRQMMACTDKRPRDYLQVYFYSRFSFPWEEQHQTAHKPALNQLYGLD